MLAIQALRTPLVPSIDRREERQKNAAWRAPASARDEQPVSEINRSGGQQLKKHEELHSRNPLEWGPEQLVRTARD
jgi:hypothetical protein